MKIRTMLAAAVTVFSSALVAQDSVTNSDLSRYTSTYVVDPFLAKYATNSVMRKYFDLSRCVRTNDPPRISVDDAVNQLRAQGDMTKLVKKLAESGDVCAVVGHKWASSYVTTEYPSDGNYAMRRVCSLCGKIETRESEMWK
jgi:hypothetical protein